MRKQIFETLRLEKIVGGGQAIGTLDDGRKAFVWGGLPKELVTIRVTKKKSHFVEGVVTEIIEKSPERITPRDENSYLSTSPWQIMPMSSEQFQKISLIEEAFSLHNITLPEKIKVFSDGVEFNYRNKVEFSWFGDTTENSTKETLDLAFFKRGGKGKVIVDGTSLAHPSINKLAIEIRDLLRTKPIVARQLKTLLIRSDQQGNAVWQLYVKDKIENLISDDEAKLLSAAGGEIIYSNPKSPASRITERLNKFGDTTLSDTILGVAFNYACEGFFQVNIPVYEKALSDMKAWINCNEKLPILDLYSGVGTIGLTIGGDDVTLVEINEHAVAEMQRNIAKLNRPSAKAILAPSEKSLECITGEQIVIVDPPRAGLHSDVTNRLLKTEPPRIIYLSCNPVTQARDVSLLQEKYKIVHHQGYNFFPRTPHIEHLVVLDKNIQDKVTEVL
ncbi:class I SAM-dependent RNA methyltransferase [Candidatus Nanosynbacter sp. HMT-352]|uniref:class I SAM-dependent RNA methyltransferase n=1 Tax=Candidatus Nanosynbacter sp. HMT-352 TaxID=2899133 RepID=UPI001E4680F9|nr:RsmD family RNA methyltransferase [Candidatus Nanosynbacter sp. HMT-352]UHA57608.1 RsmD family RNA methyltransferase [Candidatus Nanosynbacter sp. HMT-352]